jgi:hypothetical protein
MDTRCVDRVHSTLTATDTSTRARHCVHRALPQSTSPPRYDHLRRARSGHLPPPRRSARARPPRLPRAIRCAVGRHGRGTSSFRTRRRRPLLQLARGSGARTRRLGRRARPGGRAPAARRAPRRLRAHAPAAPVLRGHAPGPQARGARALPPCRDGTQGSQDDALWPTYISSEQQRLIDDDTFSYQATPAQAAHWARSSVSPFTLSPDSPCPTARSAHVRCPFCAAALDTALLTALFAAPDTPSHCGGCGEAFTWAGLGALRLARDLDAPSEHNGCARSDDVLLPRQTT